MNTQRSKEPRTHMIQDAEWEGQSTPHLKTCLSSRYMGQDRICTPSSSSSSAALSSIFTNLSHSVDPFSFSRLSGIQASSKWDSWPPITSIDELPKGYAV